MIHILKKSLKGRKGKRESSASSTTAMLIHKLNLPYFPQFEQFNEDIRKLILSFVAEAPQKIDEYQQGSLVATLPLVNKEFSNFATLDYFWEPILRRQLLSKDHGNLWKEGLRRILPHDIDMSGINDDTGNDNDDNESSRTLERIVQTISEQFENGLTYRDIYRKVFTTHVYFDAPVFMMHCHLKIGEIYGLHMFEQRYRIMIHDLMNECENPIEASNGGKIRIGRKDGVLNPPVLIHACSGSRLVPGVMACLVQVVWVNTYQFGTADVRLLPIAWVRLDRLWIRRNASNLYYAKAYRLPIKSNTATTTNTTTTAT